MELKSKQPPQPVGCVIPSLLLCPQNRQWDNASSSRLGLCGQVWAQRGEEISQLWNWVDSKLTSRSLQTAPTNAKVQEHRFVRHQWNVSQSHPWPSRPTYHRFHFNEKSTSGLLSCLATCHCPMDHRKSFNSIAISTEPDLMKLLSQSEMLATWTTWPTLGQTKKRLLNLPSNLSFCLITVAWQSRSFTRTHNLSVRTLTRTCLPRPFSLTRSLMTSSTTLAESSACPTQCQMTDCLTYAGKFGNVKEWIKGKVDINLDNEP